MVVVDCSSYQKNLLTFLCLIFVVAQDSLKSIHKCDLSAWTSVENLDEYKNNNPSTIRM